MDALFVLGCSAAINGLDVFNSGVLSLNLESPPEWLKEIISTSDNRNGKYQWGVYTSDEVAAAGFALLLGSNGVYEITRGISGYYHFHDKNHLIHVWYGEMY